MQLAVAAYELSLVVRTSGVGAVYYCLVRCVFLAGVACNACGCDLNHWQSPEVLLVLVPCTVGRCSVFCWQLRRVQLVVAITSSVCTVRCWL